MQTIAATPASTEWKIPVAPVSTPAAPAKLRPVPLPPKSNFFEGAKGVVINASGTRAVVGYAGANPGPNQKGASRVVLCDLENGKMLGAGSVPGLYVPLALNDEGTQVLMRSDEFGPGHHDKLELWSVSKTSVSRGTQWIPYEGVNGAARDVRWGAFLDAQRLATISEEGKLVLWQLKPLKPLSTMQLQSGCTPGLSPDRKLMAITTGKEIGVFDVAAGEVLALAAGADAEHGLDLVRLQPQRQKARLPGLRQQDLCLRCRQWITAA